MKLLQKVLTGLVGVEIAASLVLCGGRLNATLPEPPPVGHYCDVITGRALLALPDRFLFDGGTKWRTLADAYMIRGFFSKAEACLRQAAQSDPGAADVALARGFCLERLGMLEDAGDEFRRAASLGPKDVAESGWYRLGLIFLQLEQPEEAQQAFENAGEGHLLSVYQRARLLVRGGRPSAALPLLERLAAGHPNDLRVWQLRARAAEALGQSALAAAARDAVERAGATLELNKPLFLGTVDSQFGADSEIAHAFELQKAGNKVLAAERILHLAADENRLQNKNLYYLEGAAPFLMEAGNFTAARTLLDRQIDRDRFSTARAWELRSFVDFMDGRANDVWEDWGHAQRLRPDAIQQDWIAAFARRSGDPVAAQKHLALAKLYAGLDAYRNNNLSEALSTLRETANLNPESACVWYYLGQTERLLGDRTAAEADYRRCLKLNPEHGRARGQLDRLENASVPVW